MARTSRNGAPAASFDEIDNIDIDDMFGDGDDDLFGIDGLADDLGLEMGDITNNIAAVPTPEEDTGAAASAEDQSAPTPAPVPAIEEPPKRRKTKRKPKSPILLDDEEEANEAPSKKKRKSSKSGSSKKKSSKKDKDKDEAKADAPPKSKGKLKGIGLPTALQRHSSSSGPTTPSSGHVAAAGQFGGRQKRGGHFALPLSRANSEKHKTKNKGTLKAAAAITDGTPPATSGSSSEKVKQKKPITAANTTTASPEPPAPKKPATYAPPIPQSTFCGIKPSSTIFYPFMPALPAEPSIKNRKQYPAVDRINSSFMAFINNAPNAAKGSNGGAPVSETEYIHRLMLETLKDMTPSGGQGSAATTTGQDDKKATMSNAIGSLRQTVATMEKPKLATDLFSACALLKRQYDFLQQNLSNMERWCKDNFSEADYAATYGPPEGQKNQKEAAAADSILSKFKRPLIKVKIKCNGFKEPKLSGPLFAFLPASVVPPATSPVEQSKEKKTTKKRKSTTSSDPAVAAATSTIVAVVEKEVVIKTYPELRPSKRRQLITDHVAHTAKELEAACISRTTAFCQAIDRRHTELKKMVDEDEVLVVHTAAMWQYIDKAGYFSDITEEVLNDTLRSVWAPEVKHDVVRDIHSPGKPLATKIRPDGESRGSVRKSVFSGLQSLLVDESSEIETDDESEGEDEVLLHDNFDEPLHPQDPTLRPGSILVDISGLTLDERAHMHLRRAGMLENHPPPGPNEVSNGLATNSSRGRKDGLGVGAVDGRSAGGDTCTLEDVIERMSTHLIDVNMVNNARASFLESNVRAQMSASGNGKSKTDQDALIAKCQQLLKKSKDNKVKTSQSKTSAKDEYALPW